MSVPELQRRITFVVIDTDAYAMSLRALERSLRVLPVGRVLIYSDDPGRWGGFGGSVRRIPRIRSLEDYQDLSVRRLVEDVTTDYCIVLQWDGFTLHGSEFSPIFRHYDYIGAAWLQHREFSVGNSGFNWRSRAFLEASARLADQRWRDEPDDLFLCRRMRVTLETRSNIRFAPEAIADHFSIESRSVPWRTFGFHGALHLPVVYRADLPFLVENLPQRAVPRLQTRLDPFLLEAGEDVRRRWAGRVEAARAGLSPVLPATGGAVSAP